MKTFFFLFLFTTQFLFAGQHQMKLTFVDGYNNAPIVNQTVKVEIVKPKFSQTFRTDVTGAITFSFKSGDFIEYNFTFTSGDFETQTRQRYFDEEKDADITFYLYPSHQYEKRIETEESTLLSQYEELKDESICSYPSYPIGGEVYDNFIYKNLQTPYDYGDLGFEAHFTIEFILGPDGQAYLIKVVESSDENLNMEAIRLVRAIPHWSVKECNGKKYKRKISLPLDIDLGMDFE
jgi:hypothetical protein